MAGKIVVIGFPKSGTSTLTEAFEKSGLVARHWRHKGKVVGKLVYDGWFDKGDPFAHFDGVDALTQMDYCRPGEKMNVWPNLDIALLLAMRRLHPDTKFILNWRDSVSTANSMSRWANLLVRLNNADVTGLPLGRGKSEQDVARWIDTHAAAVREIFAGDKNFLDLDITAPDAAQQLTAFLGREIGWWGVANANPADSTTRLPAWRRRLAAVAAARSSETGGPGADAQPD